MNWFDKVKYYYDNGLWDIDKVFLVTKKVITEAEYKQITGFEYSSKGE